MKAAHLTLMCVRPNPLCWRHKILWTNVPCISAESNVEWTVLFLRTGFNPAASSFIPPSRSKRQSCPKMPWRHIVEIQLHPFLASALGAGEWSASRPGRFTPWESAPPLPVPNGPQSYSRHFGDENSLARIGTQTPDRPARWDTIFYMRKGWASQIIICEIFFML